MWSELLRCALLEDIGHGNDITTDSIVDPLSVARAGADVCAPDEGDDEGRLCADSATAAITSPNRAAGKNFIVFECGRGFQTSPEFRP